MKQIYCSKGCGAMEPQKKHRTVPFRGIEINITEDAFVCPVCQLTAGTVESAGKIQQETPLLIVKFYCSSPTFTILEKHL